MFGPERWRAARREVDVIVRRARLRPGMSVLDVACGPGRHAIALARRGFLVTGVDYSPVYVAEGNRRIKEAGLGLRARIVREDMRRLDRVAAAGVYDAVTSLFNSFGYFDSRRDDARALKQMARAVKPGGVLVLNTLNRPGVIRRLGELPRMAGLDSSSTWEDDGRGGFFLQRGRWNAQRGRTESLWVDIDANRRRVGRFVHGQHAYTHAEFRRQLRPLGLRVERLWSALSGKPFTRTSWHQTFVARKRAR